MKEELKGITKIALKDKIKLLFHKKYITCDYGLGNDYTCKITFKRMNNKTYILKSETIR